jgi:hypothetical protein
MPELKIYATEMDFDTIQEWLNNEPQIAYIVSNGHKRWIAKAKLEAWQGRIVPLWHIPSGPLPLRPAGNEAYGWITDPWSGWTERLTGADPTEPYFGAGHPGIFRLHVCPCWQGKIGVSGFEWIGNRYRMLGHGAHPSTEKWWQRLRRWVKKVAVRVPLGGSGSDVPLAAWTFPDAYSRMQQGEIPSMIHC